MLMMNAPQPAVTVYGADWCLDCVRSKRFLDEHGVSYEWLDIQQQPELAEKVIELNIQGGFGPKRRIPLILIGAQILSEPSDEELGRALASGQTAESG